jgi:tetratricopeptide (TPR) repeat protein
LQKALILAAQAKPEDAFSELHNIAEADRNAEWYAAEGDIYHKQGDGTAALASWHEAIRKDPHNPDPYRHMAEYYAVRGDGELAINEMHNALEILPNDMALRTQLAELAMRQGKLDVAETEYRTIRSSDPTDPTALLGLTRVGYRKARIDGLYPPNWKELTDQLQNIMAEQSVKGVVVKEGSKNIQEQISLNEAEKALASSHFREAREKFGGVINQHRDDPYELLTLGDQAIADGDLHSAEQAFTYAKEINEVAPRAEQGISKIVTQRNEAARQTRLGDATLKLPEVAIDHYNQALIADPQYPRAFYGLYTLFARGPDQERAIRNANCFLEAADDGDPLRSEVEASLMKLKKREGGGRKSK